jgi:hypothetical protein
MLVLQINTKRETVIQEMVAYAHEESEFDKLGKEDCQSKACVAVSGVRFDACCKSVQ